MPLSDEEYRALVRRVDLAVDKALNALAECLALSIGADEDAAALRTALMTAICRYLGDTIATVPNPDGLLQECLDFMTWYVARRITAEKEAPRVLH